MKFILPRFLINIERWKWNDEYRVFVSNTGRFKDEYKKEIISELPKVKKLYSDKGLLESVVYTTYKDYANQKINSNLEEDWRNLEKLQNLLTSLAKGKSTISIEEVETNLATVETLEEKIEILLNY